jgi:hypothetical protein
VRVDANKVKGKRYGLRFFGVWLTLYFTRRTSFGIGLPTNDRLNLKKALKSSGYSKNATERVVDWYSR